MKFSKIPKMDLEELLCCAVAVASAVTFQAVITYYQPSLEDRYKAHVLERYSPSNINKGVEPIDYFDIHKYLWGD